MRNIWRGWIALGLVLTALAFAGSRLGQRPEWRAGFDWLVRTWIRPPDSESRWQQRQA